MTTPKKGRNQTRDLLKPWHQFHVSSSPSVLRVNTRKSYALTDVSGCLSLRKPPDNSHLWPIVPFLHFYARLNIAKTWNWIEKYYSFHQLVRSAFATQGPHKTRKRAERKGFCTNLTSYYAVISRIKFTGELWIPLKYTVAMATIITIPIFSIWHTRLDVSPSRKQAS